MAFFDFMNQPVGGYTDVQPEAISAGAEFGGGGGFKTADSTMTWGQLLGAIAKMSNTSGGQGLGSLMSNQYGVLGSGVPQQIGTTNTGAQPPGGAPPQIYQISPNPDFNKPAEKDTGGEMASIMSMAAGMGFI